VCWRLRRCVPLEFDTHERKGIFKQRKFILTKQISWTVWSQTSRPGEPDQIADGQHVGVITSCHAGLESSQKWDCDRLGGGDLVPSLRHQQDGGAEYQSLINKSIIQSVSRLYLLKPQWGEGKQLRGPTHLQQYCFFGVCALTTLPDWKCNIETKTM
jgi:hypothetical protein